MNKAARHSARVALVMATLVSTGCGRTSSPPEPAEGASSPAAVSAAAPAPTAGAQARPAITSADVCKLIAAEEVQAILGVSPNPTPQQMAASPGLSHGRCVWDAGGGNGDLTLDLMQAEEGANAMILDAMPMEGEALNGLGDEAGVTVQGNYDVEVMVRVRPQVMTLHASAVGVSDKKDAVIAAARSAASKLR